MKFISSRELSTKPAGVYRELAKEGKLVVSYNGKPKALMVSIDEDSFEGVLAAVTRALAEYALSEMREEAKERGLDRASDAEIEKVIRKARGEAKR
jgi:hypothetical protein